MKTTYTITEGDLRNIIRGILEESRGNGHGLSREEKRKVRDDNNEVRHFSHQRNRGKKKVKGERDFITKVARHEGERGNPFSKRFKKDSDFWDNVELDAVDEAVDRTINEYLEGRYSLSCYIPGHGNESMMIDSVDDEVVRDLIGKAKYWDITKGSNSSEPENLVAWGGEGGYWSNYLEHASEREARYILSKRDDSRGLDEAVSRAIRKVLGEEDASRKAKEANQSEAETAIRKEIRRLRDLIERHKDDDMDTSSLTAQITALKNKLDQMC